MRGAKAHGASTLESTASGHTADTECYLTLKRLLVWVAKTAKIVCFALCEHTL